MAHLSWFKIIFLALGLSVDAFVASAALGAAIHHHRFTHSLKLALYIAAFHALMPLLGWVAGQSFAEVISSYDHWLAFIVLAIVGIKLYREEDSLDPDIRSNAFRSRRLILLSLALSVDALAIGMTLSFLKISIVAPALGVSAVAFFSSLLGYSLGFRLKAIQTRLFKKAGGLLLIAIGAKILWDHLRV